MLATPAYGGSVAVECAGAVSAALFNMAGRGVACDWRILPGLCYVDIARDRLAATFLESPCTDLVFVDDDVGFPADALWKLLRHDRDIVGGVYPKKQADTAWPAAILGTEDGHPLVDPETGLIECVGLPTGFLRIRRRVLETLATDERRYTTDDGDALWDLFPRDRFGGKKWGEDTRFCRIAREAGFRLWCEPDITFQHVGRKAWTGNYHDWLRQQPGGDLS